MLEKLIIGDSAVGPEGGTKMVQKVGYDMERNSIAQFQAMVSDGCGQVGLAAATRTHQQQPALRFFGKGLGYGTTLVEALLVRRVTAPSPGHQIVEGKPG